MICNIGRYIGITTDGYGHSNPKKGGDYHEEMVGESFEKWFTETSEFAKNWPGFNNMRLMMLFWEMSFGSWQITSSIEVPTYNYLLNPIELIWYQIQK